MNAPPLAGDPDAFNRPYRVFDSARAAFRAFLSSVDLSHGSVLLPAFVGWSPREGAGVLDPVRELGLPFDFYRVDERLQIDLDHLQSTLDSRQIAVVVLIHFFGYPDSQYVQAVEVAKRGGAVVLEDEAHAMYTDLVGGVTGRLGDAAIFSLHKMLPLRDGGMLMYNSGHEQPPSLHDGAPAHFRKLPWHFDLHAIADRRVENAKLLSRLVRRMSPRVELLWDDPPPGVVPQTLPVRIRGADRDALYHRLRGERIGVVTLYHTLVDSIIEQEFPQSYKLRKDILNLPIHQDLDSHSIQHVASKLEQAVNGR